MRRLGEILYGEKSPEPQNALWLKRIAPFTCNPYINENGRWVPLDMLNNLTEEQWQELEKELKEYIATLFNAELEGILKDYIDDLFEDQSESLEEWKTETEGNIENWEEETTGELTDWKSDVEDDISNYKDEIDEDISDFKDSVEDDIDNIESDVTTFKSDVTQAIEDNERVIANALIRHEEALN